MAGRGDRATPWLARPALHRGSMLGWEATGHAGHSCSGRIGDDHPGSRPSCAARDTEVAP